MTCGNQVTIVTNLDKEEYWGRYIEIEVLDAAGEPEQRVLIAVDYGPDDSRQIRLANTIAGMLAHGRPITRVTRA